MTAASQRAGAQRRQREHGAVAPPSSASEVIRGNDDGGNSNAIAAVEELGDALRARFGGRVAALNAPCSAPRQFVNVRGRVSPLVENASTPRTRSSSASRYAPATW